MIKIIPNASLALGIQTVDKAPSQEGALSTV